MDNITLGYVHPGTLTHDFHESVIRAHDSGVVTHTISAKSGPLVSKARNEIVEAFAWGTDDDFLLFADTDIKFMPDDVRDLAKEHLPIVSGLYTSFMQDGSIFAVAMFRNPLTDAFEKHTTEQVYAEGKGKKKIEVLGVGMGFCLIKRKVIVDLLKAKPDGTILWPFAEVSEGGKHTGEDTTFCIRAALLGYKSYLCLDVPVGHVKSGLLYPEGRS